ncbi:hypothetical protein M422DRAFT_47578 [Sphaerobolus stellatus SS14]|uniref:RRM domain-containing protein n=1 Tax=Sphaerobolus stellatus (strain SS14) TaxID=990650 RepID=A0A0C9VAU1_SPHS4|nr:hypothetical protein M422DRAFT_47578 [Sphaerobolus stellatus SS14]
MQHIRNVKTTVILKNIPKTVIHSDIRRLLAQNRINSAQEVFLECHRFIPTGKAFVTFANAAQATEALEVLKKTRMAGRPIEVAATQDTTKPRQRGREGKEAAADRGAITGNGLDGGVTDHGTGVVVYGLPGKMKEEAIAKLVANVGVRLQGGEWTRTNVIKVPLPAGSSRTSRFYVRTDSKEDANRLVRRLHMTPYTWGGKEEFKQGFTTRAQIVY